MSDDPIIPPAGAERTIRTFLFLPTTLPCPVHEAGAPVRYESETRWLERATIVQRCERYEACYGWSEAFEWVDDRWDDSTS